jgi:hypothetical protein
MLWGHDDGQSRALLMVCLIISPPLVPLVIEGGGASRTRTFDTPSLTLCSSYFPPAPPLIAAGRCIISIVPQLPIAPTR